jgi:nucleoside-triphosphatase THEP1
MVAAVVAVAVDDVVVVVVDDVGKFEKFVSSAATTAKSVKEGTLQIATVDVESRNDDAKEKTCETATAGPARTALQNGDHPAVLLLQT